MILPVTRRDFVNLVGRAGGAAAVYGTLDAMGLLAPPAAAEARKLARGSGRGVHGAILEAGMAGLTAAYELSKARRDNDAGQRAQALTGVGSFGKVGR